MNKANPSNTLVLIAAYNEARHIGAVVKDIGSMGYPVLVVDDSSSDDTAKVSKSSGAEVISHRCNMGKGRALRTGFSRALEKRIRWVLIMDGDGQHLPQDIPKFIEKSEEPFYGIVNGNRLHKASNMPRIRFWTNHVMSRIVSFFAGVKIVDSQCGFKMLSTSFLEEAKLSSDRFEIEDELLLEAARLKYGIRHAEVASVYGLEKSHIDPIKDTVRFLSFLIKWKKNNK